MTFKRLFISLLFFSNILLAQEDYKYVVVKSKFDFLKSIDAYSTSSLTKFLFKKKGFTVFLDNEELPEDLANNRCGALYVDVQDDSGFLVTKSIIDIKDCKGKLILRSKTGLSRLKSYKRAYYESIKNAFSTIKDFRFKKTKEKSKTVETVKLISTAKTKVKSTDKKIIELNAYNVGEEIYLFDSNKKLKFKLKATKSKNKYKILEKNGSLERVGDYWLATYQMNGKDVTEKFNIKF